MAKFTCPKCGKHYPLEWCTKHGFFHDKKEAARKRKNLTAKLKGKKLKGKSWASVLETAAFNESLRKKLPVPWPRAQSMSSFEAMP